MYRFLLNTFHVALCLLGLAALSNAAAESFADRIQRTLGASGVNSADEVLHPDAAFVFSAAPAGPQALSLNWQVADGYYLYHDKFSFAIKDGPLALNREAIAVPGGTIKADPFFGQVEINEGEIEIDLPVNRASLEEATATLEVGYQGCKADSICYPPIKKLVPLTLAAFAGSAQAATAQEDAPIADRRSQLSTQDAITQGLKDGTLLINVLAFFGFGLLLSLTPCIFPMIPILSGIIVGQGKTVTVKRGFMLSLAYVMAMAISYAILGVIAGSFHFNLQAAAQNIWVISAFSAVFVLLALSMFGFYELQLPVALQGRLLAAGKQRKSGTLYGAAVMGMLSALIAGPCVAPPLAGALLYISQTGDAVLGGLALFALGLGLGVPLLILGGSAGTLLPRAGAWMESIKRVFGVVMLAVAIWFMERVIPAQLALMLWAMLLIVAAIYLGALDRPTTESGWQRLWKGLGLVMLIYGAVLVVGAASGGKDLFQPLPSVGQLAGEREAEKIPFTRIKNLDELNRQLAMANAAGSYVMLDFYADWCTSCIEMEEHTFPDKRVQAALQELVLLQADVTATDEEDRALMTAFNLFGPPAILFFAPNGKEARAHRLLGFIEADEFLQHLQQAVGS